MKKTIGIDARMYGLKHAGIGRYTTSLLDKLIKLDNFSRFHWILFTHQEDLAELKEKYKDKFHYIKANFSHYSLAEQLIFPLVLYKINCDLVHFPHFNVPVFYRKPFVITIHDLIKNYFRGPETTTRNQFVYHIKYLGYQLVIKNAIRKAKKIFTPSQFIKKQVINQYQANPEKIIATPEGIDDKFSIFNPPACLSGRQAGRAGFQFSNKEKEKILKKYQIKKPYLLYVGSVYPHKNIDRLIEAVKVVRKEIPQINLVIVCSRNIFWKRLKKKINLAKAKNFIKLTGFVPDQDMAILYQEAVSFVFPSLSEGFGLPPLEAMASGCPVISSNATCLPEIYGNAALFFDPLDSKDIAKKIINMAKNKKLRDQYRARGLKKAGEYSWEKMAKKTFEEYQKIISNI
jgi:glycosyltransferase involved in cell wall biosynthesis